MYGMDPQMKQDAGNTHHEQIETLASVSACNLFASFSRSSSLSLLAHGAGTSPGNTAFLFFPYASVFFFADDSGTLSLSAKASNSAADSFLARSVRRTLYCDWIAPAVLPGNRGAAAAATASQNLLVPLSPTLEDARSSYTFLTSFMSAKFEPVTTVQDATRHFELVG